jgi:hypothetical protein
MAEPAAGDLSVCLAAVRRQAATVVLPPPLLEGWSSLSAGEYAVAVRRLTALLDDLRQALAVAAAVIPPP